jgi:hypothetical protein
MKLHQFTKNYNITNPDWSEIPTGFPYCDTADLSRQEKIIFETATIAWINEHKLDFFGQIFTNSALWSITILFIGTVLISAIYYADIKYKLGLTFLTNFFA